MNKQQTIEAVLLLLQTEHISLKEFQHDVILHAYQHNLQHLYVQRQALMQTSIELGVGETSIRRLLENH